MLSTATKITTRTLRRRSHSIRLKHLLIPQNYSLQSFDLPYVFPGSGVHNNNVRVIELFQKFRSCPTTQLKSNVCDGSFR